MVSIKTAGAWLLIYICLFEKFEKIVGWLYATATLTTAARVGGLRVPRPRVSQQHISRRHICHQHHNPL